MKIIIFSLLLVCAVSLGEKPINIKVVPAKSNKLTIDDLDQIKMEVFHDMNEQLRDMEDDILEKERMKEKTASSWANTVNIIIN